jgi:hypothetical protein
VLQPGTASTAAPTIKSTRFSASGIARRRGFEQFGDFGEPQSYHRGSQFYMHVAAKMADSGDDDDDQIKIQ